MASFRMEYGRKTFTTTTQTIWEVLLTLQTEKEE